MLGAAALMLGLVAGPAAAGQQSVTDGVDLRSPTRNTQLRAAALATFEDRRIDLSQDWGDAHACLVWRRGGVLECFRTEEALEAREAALAPLRDALDRLQGSATVPAPTSSGPTAATAAYSYSCSSPLRLYEYDWYGGRRLSFWDRGFWQNLADYGFDDRLSSYIVGGCYVYLASDAWGGGYWYDGPTYPYAGEPSMPWYWQDTVSSIYIG